MPSGEVNVRLCSLLSALVCRARRAAARPVEREERGKAHRARARLELLRKS